MRFAVYTSCALNYLPKARALAESLARFHPDVRLTLCLNDVLPKDLDPAAEPFAQIWTPADLGYSRAWIFEHNVMELCTAVKGQALRRMLAEEDASVILYLDPDVYLFGRLDPIDDYLGDHSIGLVPHILRPEECDIGVRLTEMSITEHGIYNLGHLVVRKDEIGVAFADWWAARLDQYCFDERDRGLFTDQRWVDLAPAIFPRVRILREPNIDVASWNLFGRTIAQRAECGEDPAPRFDVDGKPLITYHFSGTGPTGTHRRVRDVFDPGNAATAEIERIYEDAIARHGQAEFEQYPFAYDSFDNGEPVTAELRKLYRRHGDLRRAFPDPFACPSDRLNFLEWVRQHRPGLVGGYRIPSERLEAAFHDLFDAEYYLSEYPDAAEQVASGQFSSALEHYCLLGSRLFMDPNEFFVSSYYHDRGRRHEGHTLREQAGTMRGTLLWHYLEVGLPNRIEPIEFFDSFWYLAENPDLPMALRTGQILSPLGHFLRHGSGEGRNPGPTFLGNRYLEASPRARELLQDNGVRGAFGAFVKLGGVLGRALV
ncbi:MAG: hypothetical protein AAFP68_07765 [Pseudomonadota bacterium]